MTDQNKTAILVVLDRSGSMANLSNDVRGGFDTFVEEQRKHPGEATLSLVQFDTVYDIVYLNRSLDKVPPLVHEPRGGTALLDAVGRGVTELGEALAALPEAERPGKVIVVIMTDGEENSSEEWRVDTLKAKITELRETYSWEFVFTGAGIDAFAAAQGLGIKHAVNVAHDGVAVSDNFAGVSRGVSGYRSGGGYVHGGEESSS